MRRYQEKLLLYTGRILPNDKITVVGNSTDVMKDLSPAMFCVPILNSNSPIAYSIVNDIHWNDKMVKHAGIEVTLRQILKKVFIIDGRSLVKKIKALCERCRYIEKRTLDVIMGPVSQHNLMIAPAFYITQIDLAGPYLSYSSHHKRTTVKIWLVIFCCSTTSAVKIKVMEDYSTSSFLQSFTRFACEVGYPKSVLPDAGSQLVKGCESMKLNFIDIQYRLHRDSSIDFEICPVGAHYVHGKVERKIRAIKSYLERSFQERRLSILQWETIISAIANNINNLPIAVRNVKSDFEIIDLITPNRLLLGRNNERSPIQPVSVSTNYEKIINENQKIFNSWFEIWLISCVPKLMEHPKWFNSDNDLKSGDVILFLKQDGAISGNYQFGMIVETKSSRDDKIRKVKIKYRNANENIDRFTLRSSRDAIVIHRVDELSLMEVLYLSSTKADEMFRNENV